MSAAALAALRDGVVVYSAASGSGAGRGHGPARPPGKLADRRDTAGATHTQSFVVHAAPGAPRTQVRFSFVPGEPVGREPGDHRRQDAWSVELPSSRQRVAPGRDAVVKLKAKVPANAPARSSTRAPWSPRSRTARCSAFPVFASVALHDTNVALGTRAAPRRRVVSGADVFAKSDTIWPSAAGAAGTGAGADWLVYAGRARRAGSREARFRVHDAAAGDETYDLYVYGSDYALRASTHPFAARGVTDVQANNARGPSTPASPQTLTLASARCRQLLRRGQPGEGRRTARQRRLRRVRPRARRSSLASTSRGRRGELGNPPSTPSADLRAFCCLAAVRK